jgi:hypothetical protein
LTCREVGEAQGVSWVDPLTALESGS